ncbi:MAG: FAD/NAD(P)-binding protein [Gammaproteobacteria bacterium]
MSTLHHQPILHDAIIVDYQHISNTIFNVGLQFADKELHDAYKFSPGQFNMLYLFGIGEVPISIVSDPLHDNLYYHTIRRVGRVTAGLSQLHEGDHIGIRGPFGRGWPLAQIAGKDILIITGGLGCAPSVSLINYIVKRREQFGKLIILQGVKHSNDLIYRAQYEKWATLPNTEVLVTADKISTDWPWYSGLITELIKKINIDPDKTVSLMCGPEPMLLAAVKLFLARQLPEQSIYMSIERNMQCAIGHCGHCQLGGYFVCKDGPIFCYPDIKMLLGRKGF